MEPIGCNLKKNPDNPHNINKINSINDSFDNTTNVEYTIANKMEFNKVKTLSQMKLQKIPSLDETLDIERFNNR